jgi:ribonuclease BN (tRNA processing enzyme)
MKLTILGSGTYQPELERHSSAYLIETEKSKICFDFGRGAVDQLLKAGVHVNQIDAVFISHWHPDHVSDLLPLAHITIAAPSDLAADWVPRKAPLKIYGPKETVERFNYLRKAAFLDYFDLAGKIELKEISLDIIEGEDWTVKSFLTDHYRPGSPGELPALSYRMTSNDKTLAYSGDTIESDGLREALEGADVAVIEAGWPERVKPKSHLTGPRAGQIAKEAHVRKLILTHMAPLYLKEGDPKLDAEKTFGGEVILAKDLLEIEI